MSQILESTLSPQEHEDYRPIADELVFYFNKITQGQKKPFVAAAQTKTLLEFGSTFGISDKEYWRFVQSSLIDAFEQMQCKDILVTLTQLRNEGLLTNQIIQKSIAVLKEMLPKATTDDMVSFTMIYTSNEVQEGLNYASSQGQGTSNSQRDQNFEDKLEYYLTKQMEQKLLKPTHFALICNSIAYSDSTLFSLQGGEPSIFFSAFLISSLNQVEQWVNDNQFDIGLLSFVTNAYNLNLALNEDLKRGLFRAIENNLLENCQNIKYNEALQLIQTISPYIGVELLEILDRIIGKNIYQVKAHEVLPTLGAFLQNQHTRQKIISALYKRLKQCMNELTLQELSQIPLLFTRIKGAYEDIYDIVEPYLLNKLHQISEDQVLAILQGYYNEELTKKHQIRDILESHLLRNVDAYSLNTITNALYFYSKKQIGERVLIQSLLYRVESDLNDQEIVSKLDKYEILQILVTLNLTGSDKSISYKLKDAVSKNLDQYQDLQELQTLYESLPVDERGVYQEIRLKIQKKMESL